VQIILLGHERADYSSILATLVQIFFVIVGTLVLLGGYTYHGLIIASYLGLPVAAILGMMHVRKLKLATFKVHITPTEWGAILKHGLPFAVITFTLVAANDLDTVLLSLWRSPEEVGWYKAAYNLIFKLLFVTGPLLATLGPQMSRHYGVSKNRVAQTYFSFFKFLYATSLPIAVGTALLANRIIILLYTEEFAASGLVLAILIWAFIPLNLSYLAGTVATSTDKEKQSAKAYALAAFLNLGINVVAIPIWGYLGAAIATVVTEVAVFFLFYATLHSEFPLTDLKNILFKPFVAGLIMGVVIYLLPYNWPIGVLIFIGAVVYGVVLFALKPFNPTELEIIQGLWLSLRQRLKWGVS
jgi:O-antigen/teichoic acid export membrane protein